MPDAPELDYTPEGKNRLEIEKLHAELVDLRSRMRRWVGSLGGLIGVVTAVLSILIAVQQMSGSSRAAQAALVNAGSQLAEARRIDAERNLKEAQELEAKTKAQVADDQALLAQVSEERRVAIGERDRARQEHDALRTQIADLAGKLQQQGGQAGAAQQARAITAKADQTIADRKTLIEDRTKARLFFFVVDEGQRDTVWSLAPQLEKQGLYVVNVLINRGKREETTVIRYFRHPEDRNEAEKIEAALRALGLERSRVSYVIDPDSVGSGRKFQIWVKQGDFAPSGGAN